MNKYTVLMSALLLTALATVSHADKAVEDSQLGLSKTSVFDTPTPGAFSYTSLDPEDVDNLPRAFPGAPPQIPHEIETMLPIAGDENQCLECHDKPRQIGKNIKDKAPMPESHYAAQGEKWRDWKMAGSRYNCTQCHTLQADVKPLVDNTFVNVELE